MRIPRAYMSWSTLASPQARGIVRHGDLDRMKRSFNLSWSRLARSTIFSPSMPLSFGSIDRDTVEIHRMASFGNNRTILPSHRDLPIVNRDLGARYRSKGRKVSFSGSKRQTSAVGKRSCRRATMRDDSKEEEEEEEGSPEEDEQLLLKRSERSDEERTLSGAQERLEECLGGVYTIDDAIDGMGFGPFQVAMLLYTGLSWMGDAMEMMLLAYLGPSIRCEWGIDARQQGGLTSVVFLGMMLGAYIFGAVSDRLGRRKGFFIPAIFTFSFGFLSAFSPNYVTLLLCRMMVGVGLGGVPVAFSLFMEFVPSHKRGFWLVVIELFWTAGSVLEAGLGWIVLPSLGWRYLLAFSCIPLLLLLVLYPWLPESPHFLVVHERIDEAKVILQKISKHNKRPLPDGKLGRREQPAPAGEVQGVKKGLTPKEALQQLFSPGMRRTTLLLWFIFASVALTYYGMVQLATQLRAHEAQCVDGEPELTGNDFRDIFITAVAELPGILLASGTVEWIGRRWSLISFLLGTSVFGLTLCLITAISTSVATMLEVVLLFGARGAIMGGFTVLYVYAPEVYPTNVRSSGVGLANAFARIGGLLSPLVAVVLVDAGAAAAAEGTFALICVFCALATYALQIETKGRALQETVGSLEMF